MNNLPTTPENNTPSYEIGTEASARLMAIDTAILGVVTAARMLLGETLEG